MHPHQLFVPQAADFISTRTTIRPDVAVILGSGLGAWADTLTDAVVIPYQEIPHFQVSTVDGHSGNLVLGRKHGVTIVAMQGRLHLYEGYHVQDVVFPTRVMHALGATRLIATNAAGALNQDVVYVGDLMVIRNHNSFLLPNPLVGTNYPGGPRFPGQEGCYTKSLRDLAHRVARDNGFKTREGVYIPVTGPTYETSVEARFLLQMGGDAVGMSTVPEVIVATHLGMQILGISCITNVAGVEGIDHAHVEKEAKKARANFTRLLDGVVMDIMNC